VIIILICCRPRATLSGRTRLGVVVVSL